MAHPFIRVPASVLKLAIVVPCYNEQEVLPQTVSRLDELVRELIAAGQIAEGSLYFVDDGSDDATWALIENFAAENSCVHGMKLSRNYGHQRALLAGLLTVPGDVVVSIDADLQDDPAAIKDMIAAYIAGAEIVYGVRRERKVDTPFKRVTAEAYYSALRTIGVQLIFNHADYRLLSRTVIETLRTYKETNIFLRGLIPQLGFQAALVYYDRQERLAGVSKYPISKMLALAIEGVTSFSDVPLRIITWLGLVISIFSFGMGIWALCIRIFDPSAVPGWASTVIPLYMLGGVQLLSMGVIGQYLAKIYAETKARPRFIIEREL
ncbi:MAG TPA: glycosyltransferase family 2 protein [Alloacidobacterium sp.]|nr:glycosyltransferase family 2 protein [Alloacidobacterium sp.]